MVLHADDARGDFRPARAHQAEQSDDLSLTDVEADILEAVRRQMLNGKDLLAGGDAALGIHVVDLPADHVGDQIVRRRVGDLDLGDILAVAHDHRRIGHAVDLAHTVRDVNNGDALVAHFQDQLEEVVGLRVVERGGRLVHDEDLYVLGNRLSDLHKLFLRNGERTEACLRIDVVQSDPFQQRLRIRIQLLIIDGLCRALRRQIVKEQVFRHADARDVVELLIDDGDAHVYGFLRGVSADLPSLQNDLALVCVIGSGQNFHQRRFASAVFAEKRHDLTLLQFEGDMVQCNNTWKCLVYLAHFENVHVVPPLRSLKFLVALRCAGTPENRI